METILDKHRLDDWVAAIGSRAQVFAPALADGTWNFAAVKVGAGDTALDHARLGKHGNTVRPAKGFVFPQREVLYRFRVDAGQPPEITATVPPAEPKVVFGVRPCDGRAMVRNDKVFSCGFADPYYQARRDQVVFVGLACAAPPSSNCFCTSVGGSPQSEDGLDVLMTELDGRYHVKALTERGKHLVDAAADLFDTASAEDARDVEQAHAAALGFPQRSLAGLEAVAAGLKRNFDSPLWDTLAQACIGCGACTYLCPSCHCFDLNDELSSQTPLAGERVRTWDTCQFPDFTMHSSGHNPRDNTGARLRQRVAHKLLYFVENHNMQQCTGCGRCISHCPVGIDIVRVASEVSGS